MVLCEAFYGALTAFYGIFPGSTTSSAGPLVALQDRQTGSTLRGLE